MSAKDIYDLAPLGSIIRYSDGTPRPPERFKKKLAAWENTNNGGRLVRKTAERTLGNHTTPASFTLHQGDFGSAGVVVLRVFKTFSQSHHRSHSWWSNRPSLARCASWIARATKPNSFIWPTIAPPPRHGLHPIAIRTRSSNEVMVDESSNIAGGRAA
jgi:hypothetical protein